MNATALMPTSPMRRVTRAALAAFAVMTLLGMANPALARGGDDHRGYSHDRDYQRNWNRHESWNDHERRIRYHRRTYYYSYPNYNVVYAPPPVVYAPPPPPPGITFVFPLDFN